MSGILRSAHLEVCAELSGNWLIRKVDLAELRKLGPEEIPIYLTGLKEVLNLFESRKSPILKLLG